MCNITSHGATCVHRHIYWPWPCTLWRCRGCPAPPRSPLTTAPGCCASVAFIKHKKTIKFSLDAAPPGSFHTCVGRRWRFSRHDRGFSDERLRRGVVFDALDRHLGPSVISHHHIWGEQKEEMKNWRLQQLWSFRIKTLAHLRTLPCRWSAVVSDPFCSGPNHLQREDDTVRLWSILLQECEGNSELKCKICTAVLIHVRRRWRRRSWGSKFLFASLVPPWHL